MFKMLAILMVFAMVAFYFINRYFYEIDIIAIAVVGASHPFNHNAGEPTENNHFLGRA